MPWNRPTLQELTERIRQDFSGRLLDGSRPPDRSVIAVLSKVWGGAAHEMHGFLAWVFRQVFADTAEAVYLERWAAIWGMFRKPVAPAAGDVIFSGTDGAIIPAGTLVQNQATQIRYATQADCVIEGGETTARVVSETPGKITNAAGGTALSLLAPIGGVRSSCPVSAAGITGGADEESDASLRARLLDRLRLPPRGGSKHDWEVWALPVPWSGPQ